jgi:hypothetical protein
LRECVADVFLAGVALYMAINDDVERGNHGGTAGRGDLAKTRGAAWVNCRKSIVR